MIITVTNHPGAGEALGLLLIRDFVTEGSNCLALCGTEFEDHDLWLINSRTKVASLIGTFATEEAYKKVRRTHHLTLKCDKPPFDHLEEKFRGKVLVAHRPNFTTLDSATVYSYA